MPSPHLHKHCVSSSSPFTPAHLTSPLFVSLSNTYVTPPLRGCFVPEKGTGGVPLKKWTSTTSVTRYVCIFSIFSYIGIFTYTRLALIMRVGQSPQIRSLQIFLPYHVFMIYRGDRAEPKRSGPRDLVEKMESQ